MRLSAISLFVAAAAALQDGIIVKRAVTDSAKLVIRDIQTIQNLTQKTTDAINAFNGSLLLALPINTATANVLSEIANATHDAKTAQPFNDDDANALGPYTQNLAYAVNASIAALIAKKPEFLSGGLASTVVMSLNQQKNASMVFSAAVSALVPEDYRSVAAALSGQTLLSLQQGIDCFSGMNQTCNPTNYYQASASASAAEARATGAAPAIDAYASGLGALAIAGLAAFVGL